MRNVYARKPGQFLTEDVTQDAGYFGSLDITEFCSLKKTASVSSSVTEMCYWFQVVLALVGSLRTSQKILLCWSLGVSGIHSMYLDCR